MTITFAVDAVTPVTTPLPTKSVRAAAQAVLGVELEALSHDGPLVDDAGRVHPLMAVVHRAFAEHRPLRISPDHIWLTIAQGFAHHVDHNAEALRERFVRHDGKKPLVVAVGERPTGAAWIPVIEGLNAGLETELGAGLVRLLRCSFSTTTAVEHVASGVVALAAFRRYFDYRVMCICGIPRITLEGTVDDWRAIRARVDVLAEFDLEWWAAGLRPICDQLVATAAGDDVDPDFWRSIYKPVEAYGEDIVTGWIARLYPYLEGLDGLSRNTGLDALKPATSAERWIGEGFAATDAPNGWSSASLCLQAGSAETSLRLFGGFVGYRQHDDGDLRADIAWAVGPVAAVSAAVDTLLGSAETVYPPSGISIREWHIDSVPAALVELYERCNGLCIADVELRHHADFTRVGTDGRAVVFADVADGHRLAFAFGETVHVELIDTDNDSVVDTIVVADGIAAFFELLAARTAGMPWRIVARAYDRLSPWSQVLRADVEHPQSRPVTDLSAREVRTLLHKLAYTIGTDAQFRWWWDCLTVMHGVRVDFEEVFRRLGVFKRRRSADELRAILGLPVEDD